MPRRSNITLSTNTVAHSSRALYEELAYQLSCCIGTALLTNGCTIVSCMINGCLAHFALSVADSVVRIEKVANLQTTAGSVTL